MILEKVLRNVITNIAENLKIYENKNIINAYKNFVGDDLELLQKNFNINSFARCWDLVQTSSSTELLGTGPDYTSVRACYKIDKEDNNNVLLTNSGFNEKLEKTFIEGISEPRDINIPTCRTVRFNSLSKLVPPGDYWIIHFKEYNVSDNKKISVLIVAAPLNLPFVGIQLTPNFGFYTLVASDDGDARKLFWSNEKIIKETLDYLDKKGFNKIYNKAIPSLESIKYDDQKDKAKEISNSSNPIYNYIE
jgi:hypothetical protein